MSIRLIDTDTLQMVVYTEGDIPPYAILSHTWGSEKDEVSYADMMQLSGRSNHPLENKPGYQKIKSAARIAKSRSIGYVWVDTCSINKSSSAELSEAINSMFIWYQNAEECYAFLIDLEENESIESSLRECRWFTRGWCLQELLAPRSVRFYDRQWTCIGTREGMRQCIARITNIGEDVLSGEVELQSIPVARRMSWASQRVTRRTEDVAYSLLGIFDVNMPLLYGEGDRAFLRLQEEIIKRSTDLSIFFSYSTKVPRSSSKSWWRPPRHTNPELDTQKYGTTFTGVDDLPLEHHPELDNSESEIEGEERTQTAALSSILPYRDLFAGSPRGFRHCGKVVYTDSSIGQSNGFYLTNRGLYFKDAQLKIAHDRMGWKQYILPLKCRKHPKGIECEMVLCKIGPALFARLHHHWLPRSFNGPIGKFEFEDAYILAKIAPMKSERQEGSQLSYIEITHAGNFNKTRIPLQEAQPQKLWDDANERFLIRGGEVFEGHVTLYYEAHGEKMKQLRGRCSVVLSCGTHGKFSHKDDPKPWVRLFSREQWTGATQYYGRHASARDYEYANDDEKLRAHAHAFAVLELKGMKL